MPLSDRIKPISYLKAHAAEIIRTLADQPEPLIVTQNGEAKAVVQDIDSYEQILLTSLTTFIGARPGDLRRVDLRWRLALMPPGQS